MPPHSRRRTSACVSGRPERAQACSSRSVDGVAATPPARASSTSTGLCRAWKRRSRHSRAPAPGSLPRRSVAWNACACTPPAALSPALVSVFTAATSAIVTVWAALPPGALHASAMHRAAAGSACASRAIVRVCSLSCATSASRRCTVSACACAMSSAACARSPSCATSASRRCTSRRSLRPLRLSSDIFARAKKGWSVRGRTRARSHVLGPPIGRKSNRSPFIRRESSAYEPAKAARRGVLGGGRQTLRDT